MILYDLRLRAEYPMLGLVSSAFPYRIPGARFGKYASLVMVAPCNMACPYCDVGGYAKDREHRLPGWHSISLAEIERFVDEEVAADRLIYLTGGEPLMFPELVAHLGRRVRASNGYSVVCTNATHTRRLREIEDHVDEFSISLKGTAASAERISGIHGSPAFSVPHRNSLRLLKASKNRLEFVIVLFEDLTFESICEIYEPFIGSAYLTLKEYRPKVTRAMPDHTYVTLLDDQVARGSAIPMSLHRARDITERLWQRYPEYRDSIALVTGGGQDQRVQTSGEDRTFHRDRQAPIDSAAC